MSDETVTSALAFKRAFDELCNEVVDALSAELEYGDTDVPIVVARTLERKPTASRKELAEAWTKNLDLKVEHGLIDSFRALYDCFGREWPVFLFARHSATNCFMAGASAERRIEAARDEWDDWCSEFDERRATERKAAMAWIKRQAKMSA